MMMINSPILCIVALPKYNQPKQHSPAITIIASISHTFDALFFQDPRNRDANLTGLVQAQSADMRINHGEVEGRQEEV